MYYALFFLGTSNMISDLYDKAIVTKFGNVLRHIYVGGEKQTKPNQTEGRKRPFLAPKNSSYENHPEQTHWIYQNSMLMS